MSLDSSRGKKSPLDEFFPVKITATGVKFLKINGSGDIGASLFSDGLGHHPSEKATLNPKDIITFIPW